MENRITLPIGMSNFTEIRKNHYYYIDKTELIENLLQNNLSKGTLITRPRRFGKTLAMCMLADFFDIRMDSQSLFDGLYISGQKQLCTEWMNQYPVIFLTLKNIDGLKFESAYDMLTAELADLFKQHSYLLDSEQMDASDRAIYERLKDNRATIAEIKKSLSFLTRIMAQYYYKPVILLIDEYDVPVAKADSRGYYDQMLEIISPLLGTALKDNEFLKFAVITGCLRITKESIFTGTNNFITDTISDNRYNEFFGFTQQEITKLLTDTHCESCAADIQKWYDGYRFGNLDIYCPWDVLNYIQKVMATGILEPENFWEHTSDNAVIRTFLERTDFDVTEKFETLMNGGTICETIEENLTYTCLRLRNRIFGVCYTLQDILPKLTVHVIHLKHFLRFRITKLWISSKKASQNGFQIHLHKVTGMHFLKLHGMKIRKNLQKFYQTYCLTRSAIMIMRKVFIMHLL